MAARCVFWRVMPTTAALVLALAVCAPAAERRPSGERLPAAESLETLVEADWQAQEKRLGREPGSPEALLDALTRSERLLADLAAMPGGPDVAAESETLADLRRQAGDPASLDAETRLRLWRDVRWLARGAALKNPLLADKSIAFMKRRRFPCQMLHEYIAYFADHSGIFGGSVCLLEEPGQSLAVRDLIKGRLPPGCYSTLTTSYDARTLYFAYAECYGRKIPFGSHEQPRYGILAIDLVEDTIAQLTDGEYDDFDPCPLPDGGIAFMSTRRGGFTRCNNPWEPVQVYTLHRMDADGGHIRTLSYHETNEWHPRVLNDGRIIYARWDYVDRSAANFHGLWVTNPDGTNAAILFGNYTRRINACYEPQPIPGSNRIVFVAGAHHACVGGSLVILDPARASLDPKTGEDRLDAVEILTPQVCFPEADGWPDSYFHSPFPLSENYFLVSFGYGPIPGMSSGGQRDTTGIYYLDRFGNLELLYRDRRWACMYPVLLAPRPKPPVVQSVLQSDLGDEGEFFLADVQRSLLPLPADRPIRSLRIFRVLPKTTPTANEPRIGYANAEAARVLLGTVPVEADGSAYFRAPARAPLYFQAVDADGRAVQSMRSTVYLQPGERRGCVGCHEPVAAAPVPRDTVAMTRPPSSIRPGPDGTSPFGYPRLVQPVLDRHCVACHDGTRGEKKSDLVLTGEPAAPFTRSYTSLRPFVRWHEWGKESIDLNVTRPGRCGADVSRLLAVLADATHAPAVTLPPEDRERLIVWLDGNAPFYGRYDEAAREAQRHGDAVPVPADPVAAPRDNPLEALFGQ